MDLIPSPAPAAEGPPRRAFHRGGWALFGLALLAVVVWGGQAGGLAWLAGLPELAAGAWQAPLDTAAALRQSWQGLPGLPLAAVLALLLFVWSGTGIPGCSVILLAVGARFGPLAGTLLVTLATGLGCWPAFALARRWRRPARAGRAGALLARLDLLLDRHGPAVLLLLRLVPVLPYQLLNPVLGLSRLRTRPYLLWSLVGVLPGSWVYVQAGATLGEAQGWADLLDPPLVASAAAFALLVALAQRWWRRAAGGDA